MPDLRTLIFRYFFPLRMQLQLQQCTMHMSALLVICYTKGYVLLGRCANLKKKFEHTEKYFFLCTIPMRSILGRVPFRAPPPYLKNKNWAQMAKDVYLVGSVSLGKLRGITNIIHLPQSQYAESLVESNISVKSFPNSKSWWKHPKVRGALY